MGADHRCEAQLVVPEVQYLVACSITGAAGMSEAPKMLGPYKYHGEYLLVPESDIERMQAENAALKEVYFFEPLEKEISVADMQKIVDASEKLVKGLNPSIP